MKHELKWPSAAAVAASAMLMVTMSNSAQATTCTATTQGTLNVFLADSCTLPDAVEEKVYLDKATGVTTATGNVGSQDGAVEAVITSSSSINVANGFANIKGTSGNFGDLVFTLPGYTFGDILFDIQLATFGTGAAKQTFPLTISAYNSGGLAGTLTYAVNELKANADLSFMLLASAGEAFTSVVISSMFDGLNGIREVKHLQVSEVERIGGGGGNPGPNPVPLPPPLLLLLTALGGIGLLGIRRKA